MSEYGPQLVGWEQIAACTPLRPETLRRDPWREKLFTAGVVRKVLRGSPPKVRVVAYENRVKEFFDKM